MERSLNLDIPGKVSELEILIRKVLPRNIMYRVIRGKGLDFEGYRDYAPGDDADIIDWKASARANKVIVKNYIEEREMNIVFVVDVSDNMVFGSKEKLKCEYAAELAAALAHVMVTSGDRIGYIFFSGKVKQFVMPKPGEKQFRIFSTNLADPFNYGGYPDMEMILDYLSSHLNKSTSLVVFISDFVSIKNLRTKSKFRILGGLVETIALIVKDPLDENLPDVDREIIIQDPRSGQKIVVNPKLVRGAYAKNALVQENLVKSLLDDAGIDYLKLSTDEGFTIKLVSFLMQRIKRGKR